MKIVFFSFYYSPDISAGSFRALSLAQNLSKKLNSNDELHIITTLPNRYASHKVVAQDIEHIDNIIIHRIAVPTHQNTMPGQVITFVTYATSAYKLCKQIAPNFIIGTTSRLMTGVLAGFTAFRLKCRYFIDLRDIFSETIVDLFAHKSKIIERIFKVILTFIEIKLFKNAAGVNVVSEMFPEYFQNKGIDVSNWSFFPNGVDKEFQKSQFNKKNDTENITTILYAGNIGSGQGLEVVLPEVAIKLGNGYRFLVIGDGGKRLNLEKIVKNKSIDNIEISAPVNRAELIEHYKNADILFLHLNNIPAFSRVLPSKIFEYASLGINIVAGLSGYSAKFIKDNVPYATVFNPCDVEQCVISIKEAESIIIDKDRVNSFIKKYSREKIMNKMANHILSIV